MLVFVHIKYFIYFYDVFGYILAQNTLYETSFSKMTFKKNKYCSRLTADPSTLKTHCVLQLFSEITKFKKLPNIILFRAKKQNG